MSIIRKKFKSEFNKTRLLLIIDDLSIGGGQNVVYQLAANIDKNIFALKILCFGFRKESPFNQIEAMCEVEYLNISGRVSIDKYFKVFAAIKTFEPDIVHAHLGGTTYGLPWCLLHKKPFVVTAHTTPEKAFSKNNERLIRFALSHKKASLVCVSNINMQRSRVYFNLNQNECFCVNNGIDVDKYKKIAHDTFTFINVARQDSNKNQIAIIESFIKLHKKYPYAKLYLLGDGPEHENLSKVVKEKNIEQSIILTGNVNNAEDYYSISDVYVQSSFREAMPMSVLEAMASSLPIISTDVGGIRDVVSENGIVIPSGDNEKLYDAMEQMINTNSSDLVAMGLLSQNTVSEKYSALLMTKEYMKIYKKILGL